VITPEIVAGIPLLARLPEADQALIASRAADVHLHAGEWLIQEGELPAFFVLLAGSVDVIKTVGTVDQTVTVFKPGTYFGEIPLLLGAPAIAGIRARETCRVMRLDPTDFHSLIANQAALTEDLHRTMSGRIDQLQQLAVESTVDVVRVIGRNDIAACHDLRDFLFRNQVMFEWLDLEDPVAVNRIPSELQDAPTCPVVLLPDGSSMIEPARREVADRLGICTSPSHDSYDLAIVGGGPTGLAAAVYGASEGLRTLVVEQVAPGGQAGTSSRIENYLGFPAGLSGDDLSHRAWQQARKFGADIVVARQVTAIRSDPEQRSVVLDGDQQLRCRAVLLATGVSWRRLAAPGLDQLTGRGVFYGASRPEAAGTSGKNIFLVGGGNSAGQAAAHFADYANSITILIRGESLEQTMSQYLIDHLAIQGNIVVEPFTEVIEGVGDGSLTEIVTRNRQTGDERRRHADALFVFIGADAETDWLPPEIARDERGYVMTGRDVPRGTADTCWPLEREPAYLETSVPGVFAAGDVRCGSVKRVAAGVGEGSMAVAFVHQYLAEVNRAR
jgi:thioredoxin reductase (NADPH)